MAPPIPDAQPSARDLDPKELPQMCLERASLTFQAGSARKQNATPRRDLHSSSLVPVKAARSRFRSPPRTSSMPRTDLLRWPVPWPYRSRPFRVVGKADPSSMRSIPVLLLYLFPAGSTRPVRRTKVPSAQWWDHFPYQACGGGRRGRARVAAIHHTACSATIPARARSIA